MGTLLLLGDDHVTVRARRATLAESSGAQPAHVAQYDLADPAALPLALMAIGTASMFAEPRFLDLRGAETLDAEAAADLASALAASQPADTVVISGTRLTDPAKRALVGVKTETHNSVPATSAARIRKVVDDAGLQVSAPVLAHLDQVTAGDLGAAASIVYSLAVTGVTAPTSAHIDRFATAAGAHGTPWGVADALSVGDLRTALALADGCEPIAVIAYLGTRLGQVGRIVETPLRTPAEVAGAFGLPNVAAAGRLLGHAQRLGDLGVARSWTLLAHADVALKRSTAPRATLDATLVKIARIWSHATPAGTPASGTAPSRLAAR